MLPFSACFTTNKLVTRRIVKLHMLMYRIKLSFGLGKLMFECSSLVHDLTASYMLLGTCCSRDLCDSMVGVIFVISCGSNGGVIFVISVQLQQYGFVFFTWSTFSDNDNDEGRFRSHTF
jgi:hypothetical protein